MLYDVVVGVSNDEIKKEKWSLIITMNGLFLAKDCIRQRVRIDKNIDRFGFSFARSTSLCDEFNISNIIKVISNNKNMNPSIVDSSEFDLPLETTHMMYVTIGDNFKILGYNTPHKIMVTYHKDESYQGCMLAFKRETILMNSNGFVISIRVLDKTDNMYKFINIHIDKRDQCTVSIENARNPEVVNSLRDLDKKYDKRFSLGFKVKRAINDESDLFTAVYITTSKTKKKVEELTKGIVNRRIITVPGYIESNPTKLHDFIKSEFSRMHGVRAITEAGIELPLQIYSELRILYVFYYNTNDNTLICKKSN